MGIDLNKMRQKHSALTNKGGGSNDTFWKPEEGTQTIRIVCPKDGDPFRDYLFHYRMGADNNTSMISPRTFGRTDPIAEFGNQLWNEGTEASKQEARNFFPRMRVFAPVVVRGEEEKGVRIWGFSKTTYESLLNIVLDPEYGDITDPHSGTDIRLEYGKKAGQMFPSTDVQPRRRSSALADDSSKAREWMDTEIPYDSLFVTKSTEEVEEIFRKHREGVSDEEKTEVTAFKAASDDEVGNAFNELLAS